MAEIKSSNVSAAARPMRPPRLAAIQLHNGYAIALKTAAKKSAIRKLWIMLKNTAAMAAVMARMAKFLESLG